MDPPEEPLVNAQGVVLHKDLPRLLEILEKRMSKRKPRNPPDTRLSEALAEWSVKMHQEEMEAREWLKEEYAKSSQKPRAELTEHDNIILTLAAVRKKQAWWLTHLNGLDAPAFSGGAGAPPGAARLSQ